ncbi:thioredoxin domain-containing protein 12-like [Liolophura sinensis]|uniref:thioredoxin domain-containing protein 12-like n=1 Tax=Liolophura sinensis TaxID=3198878 RepID=UPI0031586562
MAGSNVLACLSVTLCVSLSLANDLARGWGDKVDWVSLEEGLKIAKEENKPLMVIIHKSWCGACKALKPKFAESVDIQELSKKLVMVNTQDDEEPSDSKFAQDGQYIPRIFFLNPEGEVLTDVINARGSQKYKYYYPDPKDIADSMRRVLQGTTETSDKRGGEL